MGQSMFENLVDRNSGLEGVFFRGKGGPMACLWMRGDRIEDVLENRRAG